MSMSPDYGNADGSAGGFGSGKDPKQNDRSAFNFGRFDWNKGHLIITKKAGEESNSDDYDNEPKDKDKKKESSKRAFNPPLGIVKWKRDPLTGKMELDELKG